MNTTKILNEDIKSMKVSALPSRPTAPTSFGGRGYTAKELKEAFDRLPLYIIEKFNELLEDICAVGEDSLSGAIPTGISDGHTLYTLFSDITDGALAEYLAVGDETLGEMKERIGEENSEIWKKLDEAFEMLNTRTIDCGSAYERNTEAIE